MNLQNINPKTLCDRQKKLGFEPKMNPLLLYGDKFVKKVKYSAKPYYLGDRL